MDSEAAVTTSNNAEHDRNAKEELIALGLDEGTIQVLSPGITASRMIDYQPGEILFHEGTDVEALYIVRSGRIKLVNHLENGRARIVRLHHRGAVIGLNGLMDEPNSHTAVAITPVSLYQVPLHYLGDMREEDPSTYSSLLEYTQEYLSRADTWITEFSTGGIPGRVARLVKFLVETDESPNPCEVNLLTVDEMAEILGVTPESVSRTMAELKREGILQAAGETPPERYTCDMRLLCEVAEK